MHPTIQTSTQIIAGSVFGAAFIQEHHSEQSHYCGAAEKTSSVISFAEILKALRAALSLRS
jgi:hypothetical protein